MGVTYAKQVEGVYKCSVSSLLFSLVEFIKRLICLKSFRKGHFFFFASVPLKRGVYKWC
jgi:hypothetical protein